MSEPQSVTLMRARWAERRAAGLVVRTTLEGRSSLQSFASETTRDAYVARVQRAGGEAEIVERETV